MNGSGCLRVSTLCLWSPMLSYCLCHVWCRVHPAQLETPLPPLCHLSYETTQIHIFQSCIYLAVHRSGSSSSRPGRCTRMPSTSQAPQACSAHHPAQYTSPLLSPPPTAPRSQTSLACTGPQTAPCNKTLHTPHSPQTTPPWRPSTAWRLAWKLPGSSLPETRLSPPNTPPSTPTASLQPPTAPLSPPRQLAGRIFPTWTSQNPHKPQGLPEMQKMQIQSQPRNAQRSPRSRWRPGLGASSLPPASAKPRSRPGPSCLPAACLSALLQPPPEQVRHCCGCSLFHCTAADLRMKPRAGTLVGASGYAQAHPPG